MTPFTRCTSVSSSAKWDMIPLPALTAVERIRESGRLEDHREGSSGCSLSPSDPSPLRPTWAPPTSPPPGGARAFWISAAPCVVQVPALVCQSPPWLVLGSGWQGVPRPPHECPGVSPAPHRAWPRVGEPAILLPMVAPGSRIQKDRQKVSDVWASPLS